MLVYLKAVVNTLNSDKYFRQRKVLWKELVGKEHKQKKILSNINGKYEINETTTSFNKISREAGGSYLIYSGPNLTLACIQCILYQRGASSWSSVEID